MGKVNTCLAEQKNHPPHHYVAEAKTPQPLKREEVTVLRFTHFTKTVVTKLLQPDNITSTSLPFFLPYGFLSSLSLPPYTTAAYHYHPRHSPSSPHRHPARRSPPLPFTSSSPPPPPPPLPFSMFAPLVTVTVARLLLDHPHHRLLRQLQSPSLSQSGQN